MSNLSRFHAHYIPFKNPAGTFTVTLGEEFAIIAGLTQYGGTVQVPNTCPAANLIAGGFLGLPYANELGRAGLPAAVYFSSPMSGLFVATYRDQEPTFTITAPLVVSGVAQVSGAGTGNAVTKAQVILDGNTSVIVSWPAGQPLGGYIGDYPVGMAWTGPKPGYTLVSSNILPIA